MVQLFSPLIDGLASLFLTMIETLKGYFGVKVAKYNKQLLEIGEEENVKTINPIGFTFEENQEEDENEESLL